MALPTINSRKFAVRIALRAVKDRLETCENTEPNDEYCRGCLETAAAAIQDVASGYTEVGEIAWYIGKCLKGLTAQNRMTEASFVIMFEKVVEKYLN